MPYVEKVTSVGQISSNPGCVLLVPVGDDFGYVQSGIRNHLNSPHQTLVFHPSTVSDLIALKKDQNVSLVIVRSPHSKELPNAYFRYPSIL